VDIFKEGLAKIGEPPLSVFMEFSTFTAPRGDFYVYIKLNLHFMAAYTQFMRNFSAFLSPRGGGLQYLFTDSPIL